MLSLPPITHMMQFLYAFFPLMDSTLFHELLGFLVLFFFRVSYWPLSVPIFLIFNVFLVSFLAAAEHSGIGDCGAL